jgi:hypothetical protein
MTLFGDDVLLCGGIDANGNEQSTCELYNASINKWATAATIQPLPVTLYRFLMLTLHTRPYVFGGVAHDVFVNTVYTLDTSNAWVSRTSFERAVCWHTGVALDTNTALVCGGYNGSVPLSTCFSYAATDDAWSPAAQMITARFQHGMAVYKSLFVANRNLHNYSECTQVACLSMADMTQIFYHPLKCCPPTDRPGQHCRRPCLRPQGFLRPCHCYRHKTVKLQTQLQRIIKLVIFKIFKLKLK